MTILVDDDVELSFEANRVQFVLFLRYRSGVIIEAVFNITVCLGPSLQLTDIKHQISTQKEQTRQQRD